MKKFIYIFGLLLVNSFFAYAQLDNIIVDMHKCGLEFTVGSTKVTTRDSNSQQKQYYIKGSGLPTIVNISGIPNNCINIEKAYLWFSYSLPMKQSPKPFNVQVINPSFNEIYKPSVICGRGANGEGTGWSNDSKIHHRLDITEIISGNGDYKINVNNADADFLDGMSIMVIYSDLTASFQGHLVINEGFIFKVDEKGMPTNVRHNFLGLNVCETTKNTKAFVLFSDLQTNQTTHAIYNYNFTFIPAIRKFWNFDTYSNFELKKGQTNYIFGIEPEENISSDQYTWLLAGIYYKTNNCFSCESNLDIDIQSTSNSICPGESVVLTANIPPNFKESDATYQWVSIPEGFTSDKKTITVVPIENTKYVVNVLIGDDCLHGTQESFVQLLDPPKAIAGDDIKLCGNGKMQIGEPATNGTPPYKYEWYPSEGLSSTTIQSPIVSIKKAITYYLKVTDANSCVGFDTVNVTTYDLAPPKVQILGSSDICNCHSTQLTVIDDFETYQWNTGETTKSITVESAGEYFVTVTDKSGCINTSEPIIISNISAKTLVTLNEDLIETKINENITIPLKIKSSQNLNECGLFNYEAKISFNRSILVPIDGTPFGEIIEPKRTLLLKGTRNPGDSLLMEMHFKAVLGNSDYTDVTLESFQWTECESDISIIDSAVKIIDLCNADGIRLFNSNIINNPLKQNYPNPFDNSTKIEFSSNDDDIAKIIITNMLGEIIQTFEYNTKKNAKYEINFDAINLPNGIYTCKLIIGNQEYKRIMRKIK